MLTVRAIVAVSKYWLLTDRVTDAMEAEPGLEDSLAQRTPTPSREDDFVKNVSIWRQFRALVNELFLDIKATL